MKSRLEYQREWAKRNHAKKLAYQAKFRAKNRARLRAAAKAYKRAYDIKNRERNKLKSREYRAKNVEKYRAYNRDYQRENYHKRDRAKMTATQRRWRQTHRVAFNLRRRLTYARGWGVEEVIIPATTTRMEVEQEMVLAQLEGRDPIEARRRWFANEKAWAARTTEYITPYEDGPHYQERRSA